jgi:hypothetical protein
MPPTPPPAPPRLRILLLIIFASACSSSPLTSIPIATFNQDLFLNLTDCPLSLRAHQPSVAAADAFFARLAGGNSTYTAPSSCDHFLLKFDPHSPPSFSSSCLQPCGLMMPACRCLVEVGAGCGVSTLALAPSFARTLAYEGTATFGALCAALAWFDGGRSNTITPHHCLPSPAPSPFQSRNEPPGTPPPFIRWFSNGPHDYCPLLHPLPATCSSSALSVASASSPLLPKLT